MWRRPQSWIAKSCCHFFTIWPMRTKFGGNVAHLIWNALCRRKMQIHQKSRWRLPPSWIAKNVCNSFTIWPILTKLGGDVANSMLNATVESEMSTRIYFKNGACRHIEFRKDVAIWLLLNRFSPNMLLISDTGLLVEKRQRVMLKTIVFLNVVHVGRIAHIKLQKWFTKNIHTKLKWIVVGSKGKKTRWPRPIYQRLIDVCI